MEFVIFVESLGLVREMLVSLMTGGGETLGQLNGRQSIIGKSERGWGARMVKGVGMMWVDRHSCER